MSHFLSKNFCCQSFAKVLKYIVSKIKKFYQKDIKHVIQKKMFYKKLYEGEFIPNVKFANFKSITRPWIPMSSVYLFLANEHTNIKKTTFFYHGLINIFCFYHFCELISQKKDIFNNAKKGKTVVHKNVSQDCNKFRRSRKKKSKNFSIT